MFLLETKDQKVIVGEGFGKELKQIPKDGFAGPAFCSVTKLVQTLNGFCMCSVCWRG